VAQETCKEYLALVRRGGVVLSFWRNGCVCLVVQATSLAPMRAAALRAAAEGKMDALQTAVRALLEYRIEANDTCDEVRTVCMYVCVWCVVCVCGVCLLVAASCPVLNVFVPCG